MLLPNCFADMNTANLPLKKLLISAGRYLLYVLFFVLAGYILLVRVNTLAPRTALPDFTLIDQTGSPHSLKEYRGKWVLVDFWFSACAPCLAEMRQFPELLEEYESELVILSISTDPKSRTMQLLNDKPEPWDFLSADHPSWRFFNDNGRGNSYIKALGVRTYPTYLLIDPAGNWVSSPRSGVLGVETRLGGFPNMPLITRLIWDKLYLVLQPFLLPLLAILLVYEGYRLYRSRSRGGSPET